MIALVLSISGFTELERAVEVCVVLVDLDF